MVCAVSCLHNVMAKQLDNGKVAGTNFDLSCWRLNTPIGKNGGAVSVDDLKGYSSQFMYSDASDCGAMTFSCPINGAHTPNSKFARSELREVAKGGDWQLLKGLHVMSARCKVVKLACDADVVIGQIHGNDEKLNPQLALLRWKAKKDKDNKNALDIRVRSDSDPSRVIVVPLGSYSLGEEISYAITLKDGSLTVSVTHYDNGQCLTSTFSTQYKNQHWTKQGFYFKAGNYLQKRAEVNDNAIVKFYSLDVSHK